MSEFLTRMAGILLACGFFFSAACTTHKLTTDQAEESFESGDYQQSLLIANQLLSENPEDPQLLHVKASSLQILAESENLPENRTGYYRELRETAERLRRADHETDRNEADRFIAEAWHLEYNAGNRLLETEENSSGYQLESAIVHFKNAITVNPDSSSTYRAKATAEFRNGDIKEAISTLQGARNYLDSVPVGLEEKLAYLLLEEGQLDASAGLYADLLSRNPGNRELKHGLVNVYILSENHEKSIELLRELAKEEPENATYREAAATELYFSIQQRVNDIFEDIQDEVHFANQYDKLLSELDEAEMHYSIVQEHHPNPEEISYTTALFYKNLAHHLTDLANSVDTDRSEQLSDKAITLFERSVPIWEEIAERNPENPEVWRNLYRIYTILGMEENADEARSRINI